MSVGRGRAPHQITKLEITSAAPGADQKRNSPLPRTARVSSD